MNKIFEFGGLADVYLRPLCNFRNYKKDQVVACFKSVEVELNYINKTSDITKSVKNYISYNLKNVDEIILSNVGISDDIFSLLNNKSNQEIEFSKSHIVNNNVFYFTDAPIPESIQILPEKDFNYEPRYNRLVINENSDNIDEYKIFYKVRKKGINYNLLIDNELPYFQMEIQFKGNINKKDGKGILLIPAVSLRDDVVFSFSNEEISDLQLSFKNINLEEKKIQFFAVSD